MSAVARLGVVLLLARCGSAALAAPGPRLVRSAAAQRWVALVLANRAEVEQAELSATALAAVRQRRRHVMSLAEACALERRVKAVRSQRSLDFIRRQVEIRQLQDRHGFVQAEFGTAFWDKAAATGKVEAEYLVKYLVRDDDSMAA